MYDIIVFENLRFCPSTRKRCVFGDRSQRIRVDGRLNRRESLRFENGLHWLLFTVLVVVAIVVHFSCRIVLSRVTLLGLPFKYSLTDRFHMTFRRLIIGVKKKKRWNGGHVGSVPKKSCGIEVFFHVKKLKFFPRNLHSCWPDWALHQTYPYTLKIISIIKSWGKLTQSRYPPQ